MKLYIAHKSSNEIRHNDELPISLNDMGQIENGSCLKIRANNILDYVAWKDRQDLLKMLVSKLRFNGELSLNGIDLFSISHYIDTGQLSIEEMNLSLLNGRLSTDCMFMVEKSIKDLGMEIIQSKLDGFVFHILSKRPVNE